MSETAGSAAGDSTPEARAATRGAFFAALDARLQGDRSGIAVLRIDLDRFGRIREVFGARTYRAVRGVLNERVQRLASSGAAVRFGEDGYVAFIAVDATSSAALEDAGMRLVEMLSAPIDLNDGLRIAIGTNIGVAAAARIDDPDALQLLAAAERAVQRANALGSRRVIVHEVIADGDPTKRPGLFAGMLDGIHARQFRPVYQPIVSLPSMQICGAEALVRWFHPEHGLLAPSEFIDEAERSGLIRDIDGAVRDEAFDDCAAWPDDVYVSINLSAIDLDSTHLVTDIDTSLRASGLAAERVVFEVTETSTAQDWARARNRLDGIKSLGARLAIDDFGAGHVFLDRLSTGLFDILKIDRSVLVPRRPDAGQAVSLLPAVTSMAHEFDMEIVAEGVETDEQLERVIRAGCSRAQGYLFGRPLPGPDFLATLR